MTEDSKVRFKMDNPVPKKKQKLTQENIDNSEIKIEEFNIQEQIENRPSNTFFANLGEISFTASTALPVSTTSPILDPLPIHSKYIDIPPIQNFHATESSSNDLDPLASKRPLTPLSEERKSLDRPCECCGYVPKGEKISDRRKDRQNHLHNTYYKDRIESDLKNRICPYILSDGNVCGIAPSKYQNLKAHYIQTHRVCEDFLKKEIEERNVEVYKCEKCNIGFAKKSHFQYHIGSWHGYKSECYFCGEKCFNANTLADHFKDQHKTLLNDDPYIVAANERHDSNHLFKEKVQYKIVFKCDFCEYEQVRKDLFDTHVELNHSGK